MARIDDAIAAATQDVATWESFWLDLLAEYGHVCDQTLAAADSAPDDDPVCVCGTYRSEHALCGCEWFETPKQWEARRRSLGINPRR